jgi:hypothetical protein
VAAGAEAQAPVGRLALRWRRFARWEVCGDWADDPAPRRTDVYFLLEP